MFGSAVFVHVRTNAIRSNPAGWGDTQYAEALVRAIRQHPGCDAGLLFRGERPDAAPGNAVLVQISGPHLEESVPGSANILWMISPPHIAPVGMLARYRALFPASDYFAQRLRSHGLAGDYLPQAAETAHFHPARRPPDAAEIPLVFVGGYAPRVDRRLVLGAVKVGFEPQIWGPGWQGVIPDRLRRGARVDYGQLADTYARARIVLTGHMADMAALGFMRNRSYDALASGARVVSDAVLGFAAPDLPELEQVRDQQALVATLTRLLAADGAARRGWRCMTGWPPRMTLRRGQR